MNRGTRVSLNAEPNGDLIIANEDGTITIHANGDISISTIASIELTGESLGKLDDATCGNGASSVLKALRTRGKKS